MIFSSNSIGNWSFEDNDDNDDAATGNSNWVLSIKDKPKLNNLAIKPAARTLTH
jgi:hypothetical protein